MSETQRLIDEAVALLPPQQREVFLLSRYEGLTYEQIGQQMDIAGNTVNNLLVKALNFIREFLAGKFCIWVILVLMALPVTFCIK